MQEWYVVTGDGALRMGPGMTVGESDAGTLTLNDPDEVNQWVVFAFTEHGDPWVIVMAQDKALRVAGTTCLRHPLGIGTTIRLPDNTLYISRDIRMPRHSGTVIELVQRSILERLVGPARETPVEEPRPRKRQRYPAASLQVAAVAVAAVALAGVLALLVPGGGDAPAQSGSVDPAPVDAPPARGAEPVDALPLPASDAPVPQVPDTARPGSVTMRLPAEPVAPVVVPPVARRTPPVARADIPAPQRTDSVDEAVTAMEPPTIRAPEPEVVPAEPAPAAPAQDIPGLEPDVAGTEPDVAGPEPHLAGLEPDVAGPEPDVAAPGPGAVTAAELEETAAASEAVVRELSRQRDLLAADLALAQGRLTFPPEENALALYTRVLSEDPGSPEAMSGLQAVRRELVNRALAQLASNDLDGSRQTLQAAADAGVDPQLVANLRDEVDYRQEQMDAP
jgi:hypothetical protein